MPDAWTQTPGGHLPEPCAVKGCLRAGNIYVADDQITKTEVEQIQRKPRVREWTPQNAPRIRAGVEKKDQKAELKKEPNSQAL